MKKEIVSNFRKSEVLFINYSSVPSKLQKLIPYIADTRYQLHVSEFSPLEGDSWGSCLSMKNIVEYWKDQCTDNNYDGDLKKFVKDYGLEIDQWLIETRYDFTGIKEIFFDRWF